MRIHNVTGIFIVVLCAICLINTTANAGWQIETVDSGGLVGSYTSIAFDAQGNPAISYQGKGNLEYARFDGESWVKTTVDTAASRRQFPNKFERGGYTSLAFDPSNNPAISYYDATDSSLKYAHFNGTSWDKTTVDSAGDVGWYTSLAFDTSGKPAISYQDFTVPSQGNLRYASFNGVSWDITTVDYTGNNAGLHTSLAFDAKGNPAIAYYDDTSKDLKFARFNGNKWVVVVVNNVGDVGSYTSLAFDASGNPAVSYYDATNSVLKYAKFNGTTWDIATVDTAGSVGWYTSLAFDASGRPAISYYDFTTPSQGNLRYANFNGTSWEIVSVDTEGDVGMHTSLAFNASGMPAISYQGNDSLKFAHFVPEETMTPEQTTPAEEDVEETESTSAIIPTGSTNDNEDLYTLNAKHKFAGFEVFYYSHSCCIPVSCW